MTDIFNMRAGFKVYFIDRSDLFFLKMLGYWLRLCLPLALLNLAFTNVDQILSLTMCKLHVPVCIQSDDTDGTAANEDDILHQQPNNTRAAVAGSAGITSKQSPRELTLSSKARYFGQFVTVTTDIPRHYI